MNPPPNTNERFRVRVRGVYEYNCPLFAELVMETVTNKEAYQTLGAFFPGKPISHLTILHREAIANTHRRGVASVHIVKPRRKRHISLPQPNLLQGTFRALDEARSADPCVPVSKLLTMCDQNAHFAAELGTFQGTTVHPDTTFSVNTLRVAAAAAVLSPQLKLVMDGLACSWVCSSSRRRRASMTSFRMEMSHEMERGVVRNPSVTIAVLERMLNIKLLCFEQGRLQSGAAHGEEFAPTRFLCLEQHTTGESSQFSPMVWRQPRPVLFDEKDAKEPEEAPAVFTFDALPLCVLETAARDQGRSTHWYNVLCDVSDSD